MSPSHPLTPTMTCNRPTSKSNKFRGATRGRIDRCRTGAAPMPTTRKRMPREVAVEAALATFARKVGHTTSLSNQKAMPTTTIRRKTENAAHVTIRLPGVPRLAAPCASVARRTTSKSWNTKLIGGRKREEQEQAPATTAETCSTSIISATAVRRITCRSRSTRCNSRSNTRDSSGPSSQGSMTNKISSSFRSNHGMKSTSLFPTIRCDESRRDRRLGRRNSETSPGQTSESPRAS